MYTTFIICGSPGSGKSTYAKEIASARGATLLDVDTVTERLVRLSLRESGRNPDDRDSVYFKETYRETVYETLFDIARANNVFWEVVIVGPFTKELRDPNWPKKLAQSLGGPVQIYYVHCPPEERKRRLAERGDTRDLAKLQDWENYIQYYEEKPPVFDCVVIDSPNDENLRE